MLPKVHPLGKWRYDRLFFLLFFFLQVALPSLLIFCVSTSGLGMPRLVRMGFSFGKVSGTTDAFLVASSSSRERVRWPRAAAAPPREIAGAVQ
eukprot:COSAG01_NODE_4780_length_4749_cov_2.137849_8_plen_93_part_00